MALENAQEAEIYQFFQIESGRICVYPLNISIII